MTPVRCSHCDAAAIERNGRVMTPHLTWCRWSATGPALTKEKP